jgi:hypothetical protein
MTSIQFLSPSVSNPSKDAKPRLQQDTKASTNEFKEAKTTTHNVLTTTQQSITTTKNNYPFGDLLSQAKEKGCLRLYFQNVNGLYKFKKWDSLKQTCKRLHELSVDIIGFAETNVKWDIRKQNTVRTIIQRHYKSVNLCCSGNSEPSYTDYQPGGTLKAVTNKYTGKTITPIHDDTGMGRWSGFTLSTTFGTNIHIITAYQAVKSEGIHSTYQQQASRLRELGGSCLDPRKTFIQDLQKTITKWNEKGDNTIVMIDANDSLFTKIHYYQSSYQQPTCPP